MFGQPSYFRNVGVILRKSFLIPAFLFSVFLSFIPIQLSQAVVKSYTITASAESGGSIVPSGKVRVERWQSQTFDIFPDPGYEIRDVVVDGRSQGPISSYTFRFVWSNHKITAYFTRLDFTISATAGAGGNISPSGDVTVEGGKDQSFDINPDKSFEILDVIVDGESMGPLDSYKFNNVIEDHTIHATFTSAIGVNEVGIPDESMKIGDVVRVTISVNDDGGDPYTLVSGTVGGYSLQGFSRVSAVSYEATFAVREGGDSFKASEDIPVSNLVISDGSRESPPYNQSIRQSNDPIDAAFPVIYSIVMEEGIRKIGDVVILNIEADGIGYKALSSTSINGILLEAPNVTFTEKGKGDYMISYLVQEGDRDVFPAKQFLEVSVILVKPSGNTGEAYTVIDNASRVTIDAHAPAILNMQVPSIPVGVGGTVQVSITASEAGCNAGPATIINGVRLSSSRVTFEEISGGTYLLSYNVAEGDNDVEPGALEVSVVPVDHAGNAGVPYSDLPQNLLEIYTELPEAILGGPSGICEGSETELTVMLSGRPPWNFTLEDGSTTRSFANITTDQNVITVAPGKTTTYQLGSVTDVNGVENTGSGEVVVTVNSNPVVAITNLAAGYSFEDDPIQLEATPGGGVFSGPGVFSATGIFYPELAGISDTAHTIVYTYEDDHGCIGNDSRQVYVLGGGTGILLPDTTICSNQDPFRVIVINMAGLKGSFRLLDATSEPVPGLEDQGDNTALVDPSDLEPGRYTVEFKYEEDEDVFLREAFKVESVAVPQILNLDEGAYCQNAGSIELGSNLEGVVFVGPGVNMNMNQGYIFDPGNAEPGSAVITCTYFSSNGCIAKSDKNVEILVTPEVRFGISSACIPEGGELVTFTNLTAGLDEVESWLWDFGDPTSGKENQSTRMEPSHFYQETGQKLVTLTATTSGGCTDTYSIDSVIDSKPVADFALISDCLPGGTGLKVINKTRVGSSFVDTLIWRINSEEGNLLEELGTGSLNDTILLPFSKSGKYNIELYAANGGGCYDEVSRKIELRPTLKLDKAGYQETFSATDGGWTVHSDDNQESWIWGVPDFAGVGQGTENYAWFTQLPSGQEEYRENSWVMSPCFDLSGMERPMIRFEIMRSFIPVLNGAVFQYRDFMEEGWKTVGAETPGIGWYNTTNIFQQPGGSSTGWGMEEFTPDHEWVEVAHDLEEVAESPYVTFRVALATNGKEAMGNQGFAFDNMKIGERSKLAVLEHFTDNSHDSSRMADNIIDAVSKKFRTDVIDLQYHMSYYAYDPMYANNPESTSARIFHYGVPSIPYAVLDGGTHSGLRYQLGDMSNKSLGDQILLQTLEEPAFDLELNVDWKESRLEAQTYVTCIKDRFEDAIQLYLVVMESSVTAYSGRNGDTEFRNVVLDMLPAPTGRLLGDRWVKDKSESRTDTWVYQPYVEDVNELAVVAFLQDRSTNEIIQAEVQYRDRTVNVAPLNQQGNHFMVYPNPAGKFLYAFLGDGLNDQSSLELIDLGGKLIHREVVPPGKRLQQLNLESLNKGIYVVRWVESGAVIGVKKLVIIR